jgi:hypothetical protein
MDMSTSSIDALKCSQSDDKTQENVKAQAQACRLDDNAYDDSDRISSSSSIGTDSLESPSSLERTSACAECSLDNPKFTREDGLLKVRVPCLSRAGVI